MESGALTDEHVVAAKPEPWLRDEQPGRLRMLRDLAWLAVLLVRAAPRPALLWAVWLLAQGLIVPVQLWLTKTLVDALAADLSGQDGQRPYLWLGLLAGTLIFNRTLDGLEPWLQASARERVGPWLQARTMRHAAGLDLAEFEHQGYYDRISRVLADAETRGPQAVGQGFQLLRIVPQALGYALALAVLSPVLLLIVLVSMTPTVLSFFVLGQVYWNVIREQTRDRRLADYYAGLLTDRRFAKEVRLYGLADHLLDRWTELYWQTRNESRRKAARLALRQRGSILLTIAVITGGLIWLVTSGLSGASAGDYALLFQAITGLVGTVFGLGETIKRMGEHSGYAADVRAFLQRPVEAASAPRDWGEHDVNGVPGGSHSIPTPLSQNGGAFPRPIRHGIQFEDVWFTYPGGEQPVIAGVSFAIDAGETVALVGENGAGKTTLIKLLLGLYRPDAGRITVDGRDLREIDLHSLRVAVSAVQQQFVRYQLTFAENVGLGQIERIADRDRLDAAVARAGAGGIMADLPQGYETMIGPDVGGVDLSGGQWQRVALARGFFRDAELLVLDEPTASLDPLAELAIFERFAELVHGRTAVLISHRLGMARLADRVLVLNGGRLIETGNHDALLAAGGEYAAMFRAQARWYG